MTAPALLWFRQDLRLADNPALHAALAEGGEILPVFIHDTAAERGLGGASAWWLHHSLTALSAALEKRGAALLTLRGDAKALIPELAAKIGAGGIHAGRMVEPWARRRDEAVHKALEKQGRKLELHTSQVLIEPHRLRSGAGSPYAVYTPFAKAAMERYEPRPPIPAPGKIPGATPPVKPEPVASWHLLPRAPVPDWAKEFPARWTPGEAGALKKLGAFIEDGLKNYDSRRDLPGIDGSSSLSPHLHWGEVSPRQVFHAVSESKVTGKGAEVFLKEILWREFSYHLLWHRPEMPEKPLRHEYSHFPWKPDAALLTAWQQGRTGYPIVDAGMRQLWRTGWMHNRVRMIVASLLVKHMLQPWHQGEAWFWDTLVDADLASNAANWQWVAGCGTDAAPYFRIFNPMLQGEKFDPDGDYVRRWVPELAKVPAKWIHKPWEAPDIVLAQAGLRLGRDYPLPVVDHAKGRARALAALAEVTGKSRQGGGDEG
ncbi:deoxyribodipyrimidine photo-lyase [Acetobacteraceae bacterium H6797]|nr:deoxyribodipyrimidine photo-lyase [Acetobacteraceae bacterium H6797]